MKVAIHAVDAKIPNVALMKISAFHKAQGDTVELLSPIEAQAFPPDVLYLSKQFNFTEDISWTPDCETIKGGTGYDMTAHLTQEQEACYPDYGLFGCDIAIGRITRGCPRNCQWCVVPKMDGNKVYQVAELDNFWRDQSVVRLLDDNLTANRQLFIDTCNRLSKERVKTIFEALDIRFIDNDAAQALAKVRLQGNVHFAFDSLAVENDVVKGIMALKNAGFGLYKATFYVLIGFDTTPEQDLYRVEILRSLGVESFVMPFDKSDNYQRRFARWCNHKAIFKTVAWKDYR